MRDQSKSTPLYNTEVWYFDKRTGLGSCKATICWNVPFTVARHNARLVMSDPRTPEGTRAIPVRADEPSKEKNLRHALRKVRLTKQDRKDYGLTIS